MLLNFKSIINIMLVKWHVAEQFATVTLSVAVAVGWVTTRIQRHCPCPYTHTPMINPLQLILI